MIRFIIVTIKYVMLYILAIPITGLIGIILTPYHKKLVEIIKAVVLNSAVLKFFCSLRFWLIFSDNNISYGFFQTVLKFSWIPKFILVCIFGIDGISMVFLLMITLLITLSFINSWTSANTNRIKEFLIFVLVLEFYFILAICFLNIDFFCIFVENVLKPMFFIVCVGL